MGNWLRENEQFTLDSSVYIVCKGECSCYMGGCGGYCVRVKGTEGC